MFQFLNLLKQCAQKRVYNNLSVNRPSLFAKKLKSYAKNELLLCSRNTVTTSRSRISIYLNEYEVVTVQNAKKCSTSERYSKNIGAQRSP